MRSPLALLLSTIVNDLVMKRSHGLPACCNAFSSPTFKCDQGQCQSISCKLVWPGTSRESLAVWPCTDAVGLVQGLKAHADDPAFQERWRGVKKIAKQAAMQKITELCGVQAGPALPCLVTAWCQFSTLEAHSVCMRGRACVCMRAFVHAMPMTAAPCMECRYTQASGVHSQV